MAAAVRIVIADDHPIFRDGLRKLLEADPAFAVVGEARNGEEAIALVERLHPDVLLLDLAMPLVPGLDVLRHCAGDAFLRVVLLTAGIDRQEIVTALQLGARGVVLKQCATQLLYDCLHAVMAGDYWVSPETMGDLVTSIRAQGAGAAEGPPAARLTPRERDIVAEIAEGASNGEIARKLNVTEQTVKNHLQHIFDKTGVGTRLELAVYAIHHRLVPETRLP